jgi:hypothetical protein
MNAVDVPHYMAVEIGARKSWPRGRTYAREIIELQYHARRQRPQPNWMALGLSQAESDRANDESCRDSVKETLRDVETGRLRYLRRWCAAFPLDYLRGLPLVTDKTRAAGVYFLWLLPELVYVGQSSGIAYRVDQHRGKLQFTHATHLALRLDWHRESTEAMNIRAHAPVFNHHPGRL